MSKPTFTVVKQADQWFVAENGTIGTEVFLSRNAARAAAKTLNSQLENDMTTTETPEVTNESINDEVVVTEAPIAEAIVPTEEPEVTEPVVVTDPLIKFIDGATGARKTNAVLVRERVALAIANGEDQVTVIKWVKENLTTKAGKPFSGGLAKAYVTDNWVRLTKPVAVVAKVPTEVVNEVTNKATEEEVVA